MDPGNTLRLITIGNVEKAERTPRLAVSPADARSEALRTTGDCEVVPELHMADALSRLSPHRVAEIRHRLERGLYGSPLIAQEVANRMLESGDI